MRLALPALEGVSAIVTLQNGWGHAERIVALWPEATIMVGVTFVSAAVQAGGTVTLSVGTACRLGPWRTDDPGPATEAAELLRRAGLDAEARINVLPGIWAKLTLNPPSTRCPHSPGYRWAHCIEPAARE